MLSCSDVKLVFCFAVINSVAAITPKTINDARAEFSFTHSFRQTMPDLFLTHSFRNKHTII